jgi:hypothetical protein
MRGVPSPILMLQSEDRTFWGVHEHRYRQTLRNKPRRRVATLERIDRFLKLPRGEFSHRFGCKAAWLPSARRMDRAVSHSAQSTAVGDRFEPSQNSSRTRGFALVSNTGILRGGRAADEAIRWFRVAEATKIRGRSAHLREGSGE